MNPILQDICLNFWICLFASAFYGAIAFVVLRRRHLFVRFLDACERFTMRLGFSKRVASFGRGFSESRFFAISMAFFSAAFLLLATGFAYLYIHFQHRLANG